ncbi:unnamed protein product [Cuscuta europaea]|uniref:Uncharacterized protein n=1 Tax=Cuscuta europaea TaxID=41803 RepID=A0A9P1EPH2_CUSEU|nr:unnamed protein product [Cuscuta europaea]
MFHSPEQVFSRTQSLFKRELCYGNKISKKY